MAEPSNAITCSTCGGLMPEHRSACPHCGAAIGANADNDPGRYLGTMISQRYQVIERIARGGMGEVYKAEHIDMKQLVAVKFLHRRYAGDEAFATRFFNEARYASQVTHPNAVALYDFGRLDDGTLFIVMEYVRGESLTRVVRRQGMMPVPLAIRVASQCAEVLAIAHEKRIVHRDVKPDNIMLVGSPGGRVSVKVLDFGIAKILDDNEISQTEPGVMFGTPEYMSPEQATGRKLDHRVDIYSLGLVIYYMLAGRPPFTGRNKIAILQSQVREDPPPLEQVSRQPLPRALADLVRSMLAKSPDQRPQDMVAVMHRLDAIQAGEGPSVDQLRQLSQHPDSSPAQAPAARHSAAAPDQQHGQQTSQQAGHDAGRQDVTPGERTPTHGGIARPASEFTVAPARRDDDPLAPPARILTDQPPTTHGAPATAAPATAAPATPREAEQATARPHQPATGAEPSAPAAAAGGGGARGRSAAAAARSADDDRHQLRAAARIRTDDPDVWSFGVPVQPEPTGRYERPRPADPERWDVGPGGVAVANPSFELGIGDFTESVPVLRNHTGRAVTVGLLLAIAILVGVGYTLIRPQLTPPSGAATPAAAAGGALEAGDDGAGNDGAGDDGTANDGATSGDGTIAGEAAPGTAGSGPAVASVGQPASARAGNTGAGAATTVSSAQSRASQELERRIGNAQQLVLRGQLDAAGEAIRELRASSPSPAGDEWERLQTQHRRATELVGTLREQSRNGQCSQAESTLQQLSREISAHYGTTFSGIVNRCQPPRAVTTGTTSTTSTTSSGGASSGTSSSSGAGSTGTAPASATTAPGTTSSGSSSSGSSSSGSSSSGSSSSGSGSSGSAAAPLALPGSDAREPEPAPTRSGSSTSTPERAPAPPPLALPPSTLD